MKTITIKVLIKNDVCWKGGGGVLPYPGFGESDLRKYGAGPLFAVLLCLFIIGPKLVYLIKVANIPL